MNKLRFVEPPHAVRDAAKLASLIEAYEAGHAVTPIVVLDLWHSLMAISGSHRYAAMYAVYGANLLLDEVGVIVVNGNEVFEAAEAAGDEDAMRAVRDVADHRGVDYCDVIRVLTPYLSADALDALADQK